MDMKVGFMVFLLFCLVSHRFTEGKGGKKQEVTESFDVKPTGQISHQTVQLNNGVTCIFTYATVGGTNEEWSINLRRTKKEEYSCTAERPEQASYLFFMSFAMSILEQNVKTAEVFDNDGALLQNEHYVITEDLKSVTHKEGSFQSNLARVIVTAGKHKSSREL